MSGLLGIPINIIAWILLAIATAFSWVYYVALKDEKDANDGQSRLVNNVYTIMLTTAVFATIALAGLTVSIAFYTAQFREMGAISASLFFLEWIMIAIVTVLFWLTTDATDINYTYRTVGAICASVALALFTGYYMMEIYPYFKEKERGMKKKKVADKKVKKLKKEIKKAKASA